MNRSKPAPQRHGDDPGLASFPPGGIAVIFGASGAIGGALHARLARVAGFSAVLGFGRSTALPIDLEQEESLARACERAAAAGEIRLVIDATGFLHDRDHGPEKSWRDLDAEGLARAFALNAIGPALLMKHMLVRLPRSGKTVFATLSARVGSIGDNHLGGWYGYRASKAALNQLVRCSAIELARRAPEALCIALHPGTVESRLSRPFLRSGPPCFSPDEAAGHLLSVIDSLKATHSGGFFDWRGNPVPW